jgi:hypothetical protein
MSDAVVIPLEEARVNRERGKRAKRLAGDITTPDVLKWIPDLGPIG